MHSGGPWTLGSSGAYTRVKKADGRAERGLSENPWSRNRLRNDGHGRWCGVFQSIGRYERRAGRSVVDVEDGSRFGRREALWIETKDAIGHV